MFFVAGPCGLENFELGLQVAQFLAKESRRWNVKIYFKSSFDKANRTSENAWRGPGLELGLEWIRAIKEETGLDALIDVHEPWQCEKVAEVAEVLQIPAFLCRQTDLIHAARATGRIVNVKRGVFLDPRQASKIVEKAGDRVWLTERGTAFGHGDLVFDPRSLCWLKEAGVPVLFDCTHSVQHAGDGETSGWSGFQLPLARAAAAVGVDGIYAEVHPEPENALSDRASQLNFSDFIKLLTQTLGIDKMRHACR